MYVHPLRKHPDIIAEFACRFQAQWPAWYGPGGQGDAKVDLDAFANTAGELPVGVVALDFDGRPCGVAALKAASVPEYAHLSPWAGAGYVIPQLRGQGIGALLLAGLLKEARRLRYETVYCATTTSRSLLQRKGWQLMNEIQRDGEALALFKSAA